MFCAQYLQDHVVHFYHLHALDWVDVVSALGVAFVLAAIEVFGVTDQSIPFVYFQF